MTDFIVSKRLSKPDIDWGDNAGGFNCGKDRKFTNIKFTKLDFLDDGAEPASVILGGFKTDYLMHMLDVSDHKVNSLLPYLLSAYVYNYKLNLIVQRSDILDYIFNSDAEIPTSERARVQAQLYKLARRFKFPDKQIKWKEHFDTYKEQDDGEPHSWLIENSPKPWESQIFMWKIFIFFLSRNLYSVKILIIAPAYACLSAMFFVNHIIILAYSPHGTFCYKVLRKYWKALICLWRMGRWAISCYCPVLSC